MPTYEYKCGKCRKVFELFQSMTEDAVKKCPDCGGRVKRLIGGGAGIIFKGKGFYQTDYKPTASPEAKKANDAPSAPACGNQDKCGCCGD